MYEGQYVISEQLLEAIMERRIAPSEKGKPVDGIPHTTPNPAVRSLTLVSLQNGQAITAKIGTNRSYTFSQQSMSKPSAAIYAMSLLSHWGAFGMRPFRKPDSRGGLKQFEKQLGNVGSGLPYNKPNIDPATGIPYNFSDNIGALKVWDLIVQQSGPMDAFHGYRKFLRDLVKSEVLTEKGHMAWGEFEERGNNVTLLEEHLKVPGARVDKAFLSYCKACAILVTTEDAARIFAVIANGGKRPGEAKQVVPPMVAKHVYEGMSRHGSYDESTKYFEKAQLFAKTGVEGGIMGQLGNHTSWVFCGQHSDLNAAGNSGEVLKWIVDLSRLNLRWPTPADTAAEQAVVLPFSANTGERLNALLRAAMTPESLRTLTQNLAALKTGKDPEKFYLKYRLKDETEKGMGTLLLTAPDARKRQTRRYFLMDDTHNIDKIVVEIDEGSDATIELSA